MRLSVTSRKSTCFRLHFISIWNPMFLKVAAISFRNLSGAEICELVGIYILSKLSKVANQKDCGLYRDDGLILLRNSNGKRADKLRKDRFFRSEQSNNGPSTWLLVSRCFILAFVNGTSLELPRFRAFFNRFSPSNLC